MRRALAVFVPGFTSGLTLPALGAAGAPLMRLISSGSLAATLLVDDEVRVALASDLLAITVPVGRIEHGCGATVDADEAAGARVQEEALAASTDACVPGE